MSSDACEEQKGQELAAGGREPTRQRQPRRAGLQGLFGGCSSSPRYDLE